MDLSRQIRRARVNAGLSPAQLARKLELAASTVWRWENGTVTPPLDRLTQIAKACGLTLVELLR